MLSGWMSEKAETGKKSTPKLPISQTIPKPALSFIWKESLSFHVTTDAVVIPVVQAAKDLF